MSKFLLIFALLLGAANLIQCSLKVNPNGVVWCNGLMVGTTDGTRRPDGSLNIRFLSAGVANEGQSVAGGQRVGVANGGLIAGVAAGSGNFSNNPYSPCVGACIAKAFVNGDFNRGTTQQDCKARCGEKGSGESKNG